MATIKSPAPRVATVLRSSCWPPKQFKMVYFYSILVVCVISVPILDSRYSFHFNDVVVSCMFLGFVLS